MTAVDVAEGREVLLPQMEFAFPADAHGGPNAVDAPESGLLSGLPRNHFSCVLADPPWRFKTWNNEIAVKRNSGKGTNVSASVHYKTMPIEDIMALPVSDFVTDHSSLFLWATWPMMQEAFDLIKAWGYTYKTCAFDWMKAHAGQIEMFRDDGDALMGMGFWTRANTEPCLLATRGKPNRINADVRQAILEPRREHSRKPDCVRPRIERLVAGPYLELFGRSERPGWTVRGDQVGKFKSS